VKRRPAGKRRLNMPPCLQTAAGCNRQGGTIMGFKTLGGALLVSTAIASLGLSAPALAQDDAFLQEAKVYIDSRR
jgi:hypothetical protein